ncbi:hypothetical protein RMATCC62417_02158 [Rhizopus microsporus]|nr:hypothetical protein RMATCC62417_02158 [Rhizopus microsporus]CEI97623.1 hypothetical protein RMCBS344292_11753 [Rhizopus microsporus]
MLNKDNTNGSTNPSSTLDVLSRVQAFLPQIQQANQQLLTKDTSELNIENVNEDEGQYIEMNLGLGVYDLTNKGDGSDNEEEQEETIKLPTDAGCDKKPIIQVLNKDDTDSDSDSSKEDSDDE